MEMSMQAELDLAIFTLKCCGSVVLEPCTTRLEFVHLDLCPVRFMAFGVREKYLLNMYTYVHVHWAPNIL